VNKNRRQAGFSLTELIVVVNVIGIVIAIVAPIMINRIDHARLARCMVELRGIQAGLFAVTVPKYIFPDAASFWEATFPGSRPGPYYYVPNNYDANKGHGNDLDNFDEENPGNSGTPVSIKFVLLCQHDHKDLAKYVYLLDEGPPQIATEENDPGYTQWIKFEDGRQPNSGKKPK